MKPPKPPTIAACPLCHIDRSSVIWSDRFCRVIIVDDADYPGYCRLIWRTHVRELTDLPVLQRAHCMRVVFAIEQAVRRVLNPDKVNLASFGNMVPHLHWHIIPRFIGDAHFPDPVWAKRRRRKTAAASARIPVKWRSLLKSQLAQLL
jgi:diadenosine tetraphosphate (Ap4A) HIT family hydrolase